MAKLGIYRPREIIRAFERDGWTLKHHTGSHAILEKAGHEATLSIPDHPGKDVKRGTMRALIRDAGLNVDDFLKLI